MLLSVPLFFKLHMSKPGPREVSDILPKGTQLGSSVFHFHFPSPASTASQGSDDPRIPGTWIPKVAPGEAASLLFKSKERKGKGFWGDGSSTLSSCQKSHSFQSKKDRPYFKSWFPSLHPTLPRHTLPLQPSLWEDPQSWGT